MTDDSTFLSSEAEFTDDDQILLCTDCSKYFHKCCCGESVRALHSKKDAWRKTWKVHIAEVLQLAWRINKSRPSRKAMFSEFWQK